MRTKEMAAAQSELSMDEILASIRRIIHEEEEPKDMLKPQTNGANNTVDLGEERAAQKTPPKRAVKTASKAAPKTKTASKPQPDPAPEPSEEPTPQAAEPEQAHEPETATVQV
ncbi:MAG: hypothetical protein AAF788_05045, partial [Pseudomonadota bacterium]